MKQIYIEDENGYERWLDEDLTIGDCINTIYLHLDKMGITEYYPEFKRVKGKGVRVKCCKYDGTDEVFYIK